mmetsp:Transcript_36904/g.40769  ORF Transcript_36904/g.40769 Transcript_36904/m.40769 type:complete len:94 (+) Transcript_36904:1104-1385(+)
MKKFPRKMWREGYKIQFHSEDLHLCGRRMMRTPLYKYLFIAVNNRTISSSLSIIQMTTLFLAFKLACLDLAPLAVIEEGNGIAIGRNKVVFLF